MVEMKQFNISTTSTEDPFSSILSYTNATADLNGTVINCSDTGESESRIKFINGNCAYHYS